MPRKSRDPSPPGEARLIHRGGTTVTTRYDVKLAVFPIEIDRIDGTNIFSSDFRLIYSRAEIEIELSDRIECSEGTLTIADLGKFAPDGTIIFYDVIARS
jgi:hypothetical protein